MMTDDELKAIEDRCEKATPGPWSTLHHHYAENGLGSVQIVSADDPEEAEEHQVTDGKDELAFIPGPAAANAAFITAARTDVPALLAEVRRLRAGILAAIARVNENGEGGDSAGEMLGSLLYDISTLIGAATETKP